MKRRNFADPRERTLHPLLLRRRELERERSTALGRGERLAAELATELDALEGEIIAVRTGAVEFETTQECYGDGCGERIDVKTDPHYLGVFKSLRKFDPTAPLGEQNTWIYPPNIADAILCVTCGNTLLARMDEQKIGE